MSRSCSSARPRSRSSHRSSARSALAAPRLHRASAYKRMSVRAAILACLAAAACHAASKEAAPATSTAPVVHVDRRVELLSILQRLAGAPELAGTPSTKYVADVDAHFGALRDHPAVVRTKQLRDQFGIAFDAPMWLAVMLDDHYFLTGPPGDPRWASADADGYMTTVRDFVNASGFDAFEDAHAAYISKVENRVRTAITKEDPARWFDAFF